MSCRVGPSGIWAIVWEQKSLYNWRIKL